MESDAKEEGELVDVAIPSMGESVSEGTLLEWLVKVGDTVQQEQGLAEISTDKIDAELPSPVAGIVAEILAAAGRHGARRRRASAASPRWPSPRRRRTAAPHQPEARPAAEPAVGQRRRERDARCGPDGRRPRHRHRLGQGQRPARARHEGGRARASGNGARRLRRRRRGQAAPWARGHARALHGARAARSRRPPASARSRSDVLDSRRGALKAAGKKISFTHIIAWAIVKAAHEMPVMGNSFEERDGKPFRIVPGGLSLGLAVDMERKDGTRSLVVPVIHDADQLSFDQFVAAYDEAVVGARDNTLGADAYQGANITLTNPGGIGTVASVPRLMPGQGTIIAAGRARLPAPGFTASNSQGARRLEGDDDDVHLRPPRHPGRRVGRVPEDDRRPAPGRGRLLRGDLRRARPCDGTAAPRSGADRGARGDRAPATAADPVPSSVAPAVVGGPDEALLQAVQAATSVVKAFRMHGHLAANLDPLGTEPPGDPALDPETVQPHAGADGADPGARAAHRGRGRDVRRRAAAPAGDLLRHDRLRDRAHLRPRAACVAAPGDRVRPLPPAARRPRRRRGCSSGCRRSRRSRATCTRRSSARSSSRSRAST